MIGKRRLSFLVATFLLSDLSSYQTAVELRAPLSYDNLGFFFPFNFSSALFHLLPLLLLLLLWPLLKMNPTYLAIWFHQSQHSLQFILMTTHLRLRLNWRDQTIIYDKHSFLIGESVKPVTISPTYRRWLADNTLVQGWLLGSMTPKIMGMFIRLPTTQVIWEAVACTYYDGADQSIIYELNSKAFHMRQSGHPISEYYRELNTIWQELD
ncbi:hypothetical protein ACOSQ2_004036 [Xanthoceras sorbifolium]